MKCDHLIGRTFDGDVYILASDVMEAIAELKEFAEDACIERDDNQTAIDELQAENAELKKKLMPCLNGDCILTCEVVEKYGKENAELKAKLENVQASMYADVVDANMEVRRLKRALFIAHAIKAKFKWWWMSECKHNESCKLLPDTRKIKKFTNCAWICSKSQDKCRSKAEEYR